ncbi:MAG TPA: glycoside hydrolase family 32 protein [Terrimicrobiaceae bacterium]
MLTSPVAAAEAPGVQPYSEPFRPQFHFTPERNWMNDPNGMVYHEGEYHLFYQYNPFGDKWGHMSWGHAVSSDLVHWEHLPLALPEEGEIMIYSGSAVVDFANTSGFGREGLPPMVAIYTGHSEETKQTKRVEDQRLAYSNDRGRTWTQYSGNPVIDIGSPDFRDPKVFWHEATGRWIMVLVLAQEKKVRLYASPDLKNWTQLSEFGPAGASRDPIIWECPDLFPLEVDGETKWVLIVNINPGGPAGGSGCQYFVGDFDGTRFALDPSYPAEGALWVDYGSDFYAAVTWSNVPKSDGRRIVLGWMSNWDYTQDVPTAPWRSAMTVPRSLTLARTSEGLRLAQRPVDELTKLREAPPLAFPGGSFVEAAKWLSEQKNLPELLDVEMTFLGVSEETPFVINIRAGVGEVTAIAVVPASGKLIMDRTHSGLNGFHVAFAASARHEAPVEIANGKFTVRFLLDTSSLELFAQDGRAALTDLIFPAPGERSISLSSEGLKALSVPKVDRITIHKLKSAAPK